MFSAARPTRSTRRWKEGAYTHFKKILMMPAQILAYLSFCQIGISASRIEAGKEGTSKAAIVVDGCNRHDFSRAEIWPAGILIDFQGLI